MTLTQIVKVFVQRVTSEMIDEAIQTYRWLDGAMLRPIDDPETAAGKAWDDYNRNALNTSTDEAESVGNVEINHVRDGFDVELLVPDFE